MLKYGSVKSNITTTDDMFDQSLRALYSLFLDSNEQKKEELFSRDSMISEYMLGLSLQAGKPWSEVDDVLMPVNTNDHWIMVRLSVKGKYLRIYDSIRNEGHDDHVAKELSRYSVLLPYFMFYLGLWTGKVPTGSTVEFPNLKPLGITWEKDIPVQTCQ